MEDVSSIAESEHVDLNNSRIDLPDMAWIGRRILISSIRRKICWFGWLVF